MGQAAIGSTGKTPSKAGSAVKPPPKKPDIKRYDYWGLVDHASKMAPQLKRACEAYLKMEVIPAEKKLDASSSVYLAMFFVTYEIAIRHPGGVEGFLPKGAVEGLKRHKRVDPELSALHQYIWPAAAKVSKTAKTNLVHAHKALLDAEKDLQSERKWELSHVGEVAQLITDLDGYTALVERGRRLKWKKDDASNPPSPDPEDEPTLAPSTPLLLLTGPAAPVVAQPELPLKLKKRGKLRSSHDRRMSLRNPFNHPIVSLNLRVNEDLLTMLNAAGETLVLQDEKGVTIVIKAQGDRWTMVDANFRPKSEITVDPEGIALFNNTLSELDLRKDGWV